MILHIEEHKRRNKWQLYMMNVIWVVFCKFLFNVRVNIFIIIIIIGCSNTPERRLE